MKKLMGIFTGNLRKLYQGLRIFSSRHYAKNREDVTNKIDVGWEVYLANKSRESFDDLINVDQRVENFVDEIVSSKYFGEKFSCLLSSYNSFMKGEVDELDELESMLVGVSNTQKTALGKWLCKCLNVREVYIRELTEKDEKDLEGREGVCLDRMYRFFDLINECDEKKLDMLENRDVLDFCSEAGRLTLSGTSVSDACFVRANSKGGVRVLLLSLQSPIDAVFFPRLGLIVKSNNLRYKVNYRAVKLITSFVQNVKLLHGWKRGSEANGLVQLIRDKRPYHVVADELTAAHYFLRKCRRNYLIAFLNRASFIEEGFLNSIALEDKNVQSFASDKVLFSSYKRLGNKDDWSNEYCEWLLKCANDMYSQEIKNLSGNVYLFWIGISGGEKRSWLEERQSLEAIVNYVKKNHPECKFVFDGWTSPVRLGDSDKENIENHQKILQDLVKRCNLSDECYLSVIGDQVLKKVAFSNLCQFFISCAGTPALWPSKICRKPGVVHNSVQMIHRVDNTMHLKNVVKVPDSFITDKTEDMLVNRWDYVSYSIPTEHFMGCFKEIFERSTVESD